MSAEAKSLAEKLDEDIDQYMDGLPKRPYRDGWPEDKWREEIEKHPFFMTQAPGSEQELSPLVEGLQQLKYDENENTPDELATTYKDEGNFMFKCKKYREAIINYSAGLKYNCSSEIKATLYNNRGAANFFLKNYRSSLLDSENALKLQPNYLKAEIRTAQCSYFLGKYDECIKICDRILLRGNDDAISALRKKALVEKKVNERNSRKQQKQQMRELQEKNNLLDVIISRGIKILSPVPGSNFSNVTGVTDMTQLEPCFGECQLNGVHLEGEELIWPVVFLYPTYNIFDCIQEFRESNTFREHINEILRESPEWDTEKKHKPNTIAIYFKDEENQVFKVEVDKTLKEILKHEKFVIKNGVPLFYVLPQNSREEEDFIHHP